MAAGSDEPTKKKVNLRIAEPLLDEADEVWKERGFNSRSEFIRWAIREAVNHPEGTGFWRDMALSERDVSQGRTVSSDEIERRYGTEQ